MSKFKIDIKQVADIALFIGASISAYYMINQMMNRDGPGVKSADTKKKAQTSLQNLKALNPNLDLDLNEYENAVLASCVTPMEIDVKFEGECLAAS